MYSRLLLVLSLLLTLCLSSQSQTLADYQFSTGHDASRWYSLDSSRNLIIMSGSRYYRRSGLEEIGFNFPFADTNYSQFSVTHDGNLRLGNVLAVSSSGNQGSPFVASRAGTNNPKINFMGCAGYSSDSIYVHKQLFGSSPDRVMVVEFALQTYISSSRPSLLRWQVQLHENGDIQIVYPSIASTSLTKPATLLKALLLMPSTLCLSLSPGAATPLNTSSNTPICLLCPEMAALNT